MDDYPRKLSDIESRFAAEEACRKYLAELRWPSGFSCPRCSGTEAWYMNTGLMRCRSCEYNLSLTAGTIFESTRKPLLMWFRAIWWVVGQKNGASAKGVYKGCWNWVATRRYGRGFIKYDGRWFDLVVTGLVVSLRLMKPISVVRNLVKEVGGALGKALVAVAVEDKGNDGIGRIRLAVIPNASQETLSTFTKQAVEPGGTIRTDDWSGYGKISDEGYSHAVVPAHDLKIAHLVISLMKRWLDGTLQGAVSRQHLEYYLDEFTFRFNRRRSDHQGLLFFRLLQNAMVIEPTTYRQMAKNVRGKKASNHNM